MKTVLSLVRFPFSRQEAEVRLTHLSLFDRCWVTALAVKCMTGNAIKGQTCGEIF